MQIQSICEVIGESGCLALCYMHIKAIPYIKLIENFNDLVDHGVIDKDCTVLSAVAFYAYFGRTAKVVKSDTAPKDDSLYVAKWSLNGYSHFVVMQKDKVVFNPLDYSHCVSEGKIASVEPYRLVA